MTENSEPKPKRQVPKVIHLTWKNSDVPKELRRCVDSFPMWNPGWKVKFWTDKMCDDFVKRHFKAIERIYFGFKFGILRADLFRILVLYKYGGVYADLDIECLRPLDELLQDFPLGGGREVLLPTDHPLHEQLHFEWAPMYMNDFLVALPKAKFLKELIRTVGELEEPQNIAAHEAVFYTGPGFLSSVLDNYATPACCGVTVLPWRKIHPIPDVETFDHAGISPSQIKFWQLSIANNGWKDAWEPYVVHYWHHTYLKGTSTIERVGEKLFEGNYARLVEARASDMLAGGEIEIAPSIFGQFASMIKWLVEQEVRSVAVVELTGDEGSGQSLGGGLEALLFELCSGIVLDRVSYLYRWQDIIESERRTSGLEECRKRPEQSIGGLKISFLDFGEELGLGLFEAFRHLEWLAEQLKIAPGGYLLAEGLVWDASLKGEDVLATLDGSGFELVFGSEACVCLRRIPSDSDRIPKVFHVFEWCLTPLQIGELEDSLPQGWGVNRISMESAGELLSRHSLDFDDSWFEDDSNLESAVSVIVLESLGGVMIRPTVSFDVEALISEIAPLKLAISARMNAGFEIESSEHCGSRFLGSTVGHPFWLNMSAMIRDDFVNRGESLCLGTLLFERARTVEQLRIVEEHPVFISEQMIGFVDPIGSSNEGSGPLFID